MSGYPVLIAGGGPAGLAAALELARAGVRCAVVEPRTEVTSDRPRAKTTSARTMELFRRWGLADRVRRATPVPVSWAQDAVFCTRLTGREITRFRNAFAMHDERRDEVAESGRQIPQPVVEQLMRDAVAEAPGADLLLGHRVLAADDGGDGVVVRVATPSGGEVEVRAEYLLGCDGAAGVTRDAVGAHYEGRHGELPNLNVTFDAPGLEDLVCARGVHYWVLGTDAAGIVGRMDLDGTWWTVAQGVRSGVDPEALVRRLVGPAGAGLDLTVRATDPWSARMLLADRYRGRRTFLVGDAAHLTPPWGGHGYNTGVGDAVNLAWKLGAVLHGWAGPALLDTYEPERRPVAARTIDAAGAQDSRLAGSFAHPELDLDGPVGERRRAAVARDVAVKRGEFHSLGLVLGYHYADSPAVVDDGSPVPPSASIGYHGSARPGARLPHRWLPDGSSLYDHLGAGFTLLRLDARADTGPARVAAASSAVPFTVLDGAGLGVDDAEAYGAPLLLVRPDQHVAWRGDDPAAAAAALDVARGWAPRANALR
ncbi:FAD-dependent monooxygenase [Actinomycetospora sp. TBRC 11914]|uniref:FAD-dependent monooxygenase n=1 Tax=Actinomycetospora sp. TBRC 11914 TaxID=2729387 RepID=UPI00145DD5AE|nr:FAD-dependent monooxygenase [Actinomycetospora sp. TBRC 11914]NMO88510.1 FAD-binding protein [Actinomycetospora sp. TBRC 11914]